MSGHRRLVGFSDVCVDLDLASLGWARQRGVTGDMGGGAQMFEITIVARYGDRSTDRIIRIIGIDCVYSPATAVPHLKAGTNDIHGASGRATLANAAAGVAANAANGVAIVSFAARLTGRERDPISVHLLEPISVHCLDGHLLARRLRNTGRQGHQDADADGYAANVGRVDHNRRPRECLPAG
jgi:hypothetical protein